MYTNPFQLKEERRIDQNADIIFVSDMFAKDYIGGAELTSQALIDACPFNIDCIMSKEVTLQLLEEGHQKYWIFGNFVALNSELIPSIVANLNYSILEYDYKYCRYRSPEKHKFAEMSDCDCHSSMQGKMISAFYYGSKSLWWMSVGQEDHYLRLFPFLSEKDSVVLSSVFDDNFFATVKILREKYKSSERKGWVVLGSSSWIKGADQAVQWCKDNEKEYEVLWGLPYSEVLDKLAKAEGFVYLPQGMDTCPRMVIEAKMLGCELHLNDYVQHKDEVWFNTDDPFDTEAYLFAARERFWSSIKATMEWVPNISGYTTTKDCISQDYPFIASIQSMLGFCDEVVVVDGGSIDGTWEELETWSKKENKLNVYQIKRDWNHPRHAVFDGEQKAEARKRCTNEFLWQMDSDEVVHEDDQQKIIDLCRNFPSQALLVSLPVIEYWGGVNKVRMDINPWKWRLSRNEPYITHGIPKELRKYDDDGNLYASPGTDGCDYVHAESGQRIPHASFYTVEVDSVRRAALAGNEEAKDQYQKWYQNVVNLLPGVHHYSWFNIERKIKTYKNYWQRHWESLYDIKQEDTPDNNMFFDKSWSDVSDQEIQSMAIELSEKTGGHIFHSKVDFNCPTPHVDLNMTQPEVMNTEN
jgi:glycosyltransferase involved in cell wall biosynthesis